MDTREFWKGEFGTEYTERNVGLEESNYRMFESIFFKTPTSCYSDIKSIVEFGAGSGMNIKALERVFPDAQFTGIDINKSAYEALKVLNIHSALNGSFIDFDLNNYADLVLCKGILIHVAPEDIEKVYRAVYKASKKYILLCEYYNPTPVEVLYRGNTGKLWKRDFCGEMMDIFPDLQLIDYGFEYHRGENKLDDITWFLLSK
jgi:pseudaminic acid biosynthesis-associated methylase